MNTVVVKQVEQPRDFEAAVQRPTLTDVLRDHRVLVGHERGVALTAYHNVNIHSTQAWLSRPLHLCEATLKVYHKMGHHLINHLDLLQISYVNLLLVVTPNFLANLGRLICTQSKKTLESHHSSRYYN